MTFGKQVKDLTEFEREQRLKANKEIINRVVRNRLTKTKRIVHGSRAQNVQLPYPLRKKPTDWDVFAKNPKKAAIEMEKVLDKKFKGDFFEVKKGSTVKKKVNKVIAKSTGQSYVDYSIPPNNVPTVSKRGIRFASLCQQVKHTKETIKKPETKFRRAKDLDFLRRVRILEKKRGSVCK